MPTILIFLFLANSLTTTKAEEVEEEWNACAYVGLSGYTPRKLRCIGGDACTSSRATNIEIFCDGRPIAGTSLFKLKCFHYGPSVIMKNLEVQCIWIHYYPPGSCTRFTFASRQCIATYELWYNKEESLFNNIMDYMLSEFGNSLRAIKMNVSGVAMDIHYAHENGLFDQEIWREVQDSFGILRSEALDKYLS